MQLRQPEFVCPVNDNGVGGWNVKAAFNNGAANQYIEPLPVKIQHDVFKFAFGHLPMCHTNACIGNQFTQFTCHALDRTHFVV